MPTLRSAPRARDSSGGAGRRPGTRVAVWVLVAVLTLLAGTPPALAGQQDAYVPGPADAWDRRSPAEAGMDSAKLAGAVAFTRDVETEVWPEGHGIRDALLENYLAGEPYNEIVGPMKERGAVNGVLLKDGYIVAEWGDTRRVDMAFSVSKLFVSTVGALAAKDGLIRDVHDPVKRYVADSLFASPNNARITWDHLFRQTSEWEGTLFGKPDWADRFDGERRERHEPGTHWLYNDVRVNLAALALLQLWREPLPVVLRERLMDPIGASRTWRWHGYETSWVTVDGRRMQSVAGGGHWGGGMWISTRDLARVGLLYLRDGRWGERRILPEGWVETATTPTGANPGYGYMQWWLNVDGEALPGAPASSYYASGGSSNRLWIDPEHDLVLAVRWIDGARLDEVVRRILAALEAPAD